MHRPKHLRDALLAWLDQPRETIRVSGQEGRWRAERLVEELWTSTDTLPGDVCERFGLPRGCTYGHAVRLIRWVRENRPEVRLPDAVTALEGLDSRELRPAFDAISDLLREEDRLRTRP